MATDTELLVVGAGPAGLAAAAEATRHGVRVMLVDGRPIVGGQYFARRPGLTWQAGLPDDLLEGMRTDLLDLRLETQAWGAFGERTVALAKNGKAELVEPQAIVLATGAIERPQPFPGWELAGVVAAGAAQLLLKESAVLPEGRVVVAGTGPFLLAVASQLHQAGARLGAFVEARPARKLASLVPAVLLAEEHRREAISYLRSLRSIPRRFGRTIRSWRPGELVLSSGERIACDTLCIGHGFVPRLELANHLGCHVGVGGVLVNDDLETSRPGVYAAGETTGIAGALVASAEGRLAGLVAARRLGRSGSSLDSRLVGFREKRRRLLGFAWRLFRAYPGLDPLALATPDTIICRCEDVSLGAIRAAKASHPGVNDVKAVKALLRCGMGACQGAMCVDTVRAVVRGSRMPSRWQEPASRPPIGSVSVGTVADLRCPS